MFWSSWSDPCWAKTLGSQHWWHEVKQTCSITRQRCRIRTKDSRVGGSSPPWHSRGRPRPCSRRWSHPCDEWRIRPPSPVLCTTGLKKHILSTSKKDRMSKSVYYFTQIWKYFSSILFQMSQYICWDCWWTFWYTFYTAEKEHKYIYFIIEESNIYLSVCSAVIYTVLFKY